MDVKTVEIIDMDLCGRGIGKNDGKAVFIPGAVTGDTVLYKTSVSKKKYDIGELVEIKSPSPERHDPECSIFGTCGSCSFANISRKLELDTKKKAVISAFRRAGFKDFHVEKIISGNHTEYRNKVILHSDGNGKYGFYDSGSHRCTGGSDCLLIPDIFNKIARFIESYISDNPFFVPKSIMMRLGNGKVMVAVETDIFGGGSYLLGAINDAFDEVVSFYEYNGNPTSYETKFKLLFGEKYITTDFSNIRLRISPKSFFQINNEIAGSLCDEICTMLSPNDGDIIYDLYCGIGTIGLTVAKRFPNARIIGVEINESAVADARFNCKLSNIQNAEFICCDAGHITTYEKCPHAVIVDPPRFGLTDTMISNIISISPKSLIYMSCNPDTLAGDTKKLMSSGYIVNKCIAGDMFPECAHVETVICMTKQD